MINPLGRLSRLTAMLSVIALFVVACGSNTTGDTPALNVPDTTTEASDDTQPTTSTSGSDTTTRDAEGERARVTFWSPGFHGLSEDQIVALVDEFNAESDNVVVEFNQLTFADGRTVIKQAVSAGTGPDVFTMSPLDFEYIEAGALAPLSEVGYTEEDLDAFNDLINSSEWEGELYAVPMAWNANLLFVNLSILAEHGFDAPPMTWDELYEVAAAITEGSGGDVCGFQIKGMDDHLNALNHTWASFLVGAGGSYMADDLSESTQNTAEGMSALEYLRSFFENGVCTAGVSAERGFNDGQVAMYSFGSNNAAVIESSNLTHEWTAVRMPEGPGGSGSYVFPSPFIAVNADTTDLHAAGEFMRWITSPEKTVQFMETGGLTPYKLDSLSDELRSDVGSRIAEEIRWDPLIATIEAADPLEVRKDAVATQQRWAAQTQYLVSAINGDMAPEDALGEIDTAVNSALGGN